MATNPENSLSEAEGGVFAKANNDSLNLLCANPGAEEELRVKQVRDALERDLLAADLRWSLFVAASNSYRHDTVLRPFPPQFVWNGNRDIDQLRSGVAGIPPFTQILAELRSGRRLSLDPSSLQLLWWVLCGTGGPQLSTVLQSERDQIIRKVGWSDEPPPPTLILSLQWSESSERRWDMWRQQGKSGTFYAFHGSRMENFHSIVHHGLQQHMNRNSLFGQGVYLSSEMSVCMPYSPTGRGWEKSLAQGGINCIALCELVDHPDVRCRTKDDDLARSRTSDSLAGKVPEKYFVVVNSELVRVRHLLFYSARGQGPGAWKNPILDPVPSLPMASMQRPSFLRRHRFALLMVAYAVVLLSVGAGDSRAIRRWARYLGIVR